MPKLFQINVVSNMLSTGKIAEDISKVCMKQGWDCYMAYGRWSKPGSVAKEIKIGPMLNTYEHYIENKLFDNEGLASRFVTKKLIKEIDRIAPNIIHLHDIHDHYLNYPILFKYLASIETPVVWTQHDCWAFTGGCMHFDVLKCNKWKTECENCIEKRALFCDKSNLQFHLKAEAFNKVKSLTFVPVSDWQSALMKESMHKNRSIITIHNGIDISRFRPVKRQNQKTGFSIIGVAAVWNKFKGLDDFKRLRAMLPLDIRITLVGLSEKQIKELPEGVKGITRTTNVEELVQLYSDADVFVNPTYSDNFPTTNIEALACGTPVITYKTGGSPEAIDTNTGIVVPQGDLDALVAAIMKLKNEPLSSLACRERAILHYDKDKCFDKYLQLYNKLLAKA